MSGTTSYKTLDPEIIETMLNIKGRFESLRKDIETFTVANPDLAELLKKQEEASVIAEHPAEDEKSEGDKEEVTE